MQVRKDIFQAVPLLPSWATAVKRVDLGSDGQSVLALVHVEAGGRRGIVVARSTNGGTGYTAGTTLFDGTANATIAKVALKGSTAVATWTQGADLYAAFSSDGGGNWGSPQRIAANIVPDSVQLDIAGDAGVATWTDGAEKVMFARLTSSGAQNLVRVGREQFPSSKARLGVNGQRLQIAFTERQGSLQAVALSESTDGGRTWLKLAQNDYGITSTAGFTQAEFKQGQVNESVKIVARIPAATGAVDRVFPLANGHTIITKTWEPETALLGNESSSLFRAKNLSTLGRCPETLAREPVPMPVFTRYSVSSFLVDETKAGTQVVWTQGWSAGEVRTAARVYSGVYGGGTTLVGCKEVTPPNVDITAPSAFDGGFVAGTSAKKGVTVGGLSNRFTTTAPPVGATLGAFAQTFGGAAVVWIGADGKPSHAALAR